MQQIKAIVKGPYEPEDNQVLWIDTSNPDKITEKVFEGGEWKVVQQDYIIIKPEYADSIQNDAAALGKIRGFIDRGIISDVLLFQTFPNGYRNIYSKIIAFGPYSVFVCKIDGIDNKINSVALDCTQEQYSGLSAVQKALELKDAFPTVSETDFDEEWYLCEDNSQKFICVGGKLVKGELDDNAFISFNITDKNAPDGRYGNISYKDLQKLIGLAPV